MILIILISIVIASTIWHGVTGWGDFEDYIMGFMFGLIAAFFAFIVLLVGSFFFETSSVKTDEYKISALKDNTNTQGSFFLGTGSISEEQYYFYVKQSERGKKMEKASVNYSYVNEEDTVEPYVEVYSTKFDSWFPRFLYGDYAFEENEYVFYVPQNTITEEFTIDME